jgi:hypothetical protein
VAGNASAPSKLIHSLHDLNLVAEVCFPNAETKSGFAAVVDRGVVRCSSGVHRAARCLLVQGPAQRRIAKEALHRVRDTKCNLLSPPCRDLPDGQISELAVYPPLQKYFASPVGQIISTNSSHPTPQEGRWPSSRTRGGMRWTRQRLARNGIAGRASRLVSDQQRADERCCSVRRSRVVLTPRCWRQVCGCCVGPTGRGQNHDPLMTVAKEPVTGESTK